MTDAEIYWMSSITALSGFFSLRMEMTRWSSSVCLRRPILCLPVPCSVSHQGAHVLEFPAGLDQQGTGWCGKSGFTLALHPHPHLPLDPSRSLDWLLQTSVSLSVQWSVIIRSSLRWFSVAVPGFSSRILRKGSSSHLPSQTGMNAKLVFPHSGQDAFFQKRIKMTL